MKHEAHYLPVEHEHTDEWHRHSREEGSPQQEHAAIASPGSLFRVYVGMIVILGSVLIILFMYFDHVNARVRRERAETTLVGDGARQVKAAAEKELGSFGWSDPANGRVHIPLKVAEERILKKYGSAK